MERPVRVHRGLGWIDGTDRHGSLLMRPRLSDPQGLARQRPGAAASLREGLAETLTVNRLGVGGKLLQTLESTNPVESMIEIVRDHAGRVKRWSSGEMALRWAAAGMLAAEAQFRRVKGYQELPALAAALRQATTYEPPLDLAVTA